MNRTVLLAVLVVCVQVLRAQKEDSVVPEVRVIVSHLCHFKKPLQDPTDIDGDQYCDCDVHNLPTGLPEVTIDCRKHQLGDDFWQDYEQLPQGTTHLDLSLNGLSLVPRLSGEKLVYLNIGHNQIAAIPDKVFANVSLLEELDLSSNRIETLTTDALAGLANLKTIDLSGNRLGSIEVNAFSNALQLNVLILSNNSLGTFFNRTESDLYLRLGVTNRLAVLKMERCNLTDINLSSGVGLEQALLGYNQLQQLTRLPKQLTYLDLSGTPIRSIPAKFLPHLLHLQSLILRDMPILYTLEQYALYGLPRLAYLDLRGSRNLSTIHPHVFGQNVVRNETDTVLQRLILKGTNIRTLNSTLRFAFENLRVLDIRGAPLRCDCQLRWLRELPLLRTTGSCAKPNALRATIFGNVQPNQFQCRAEQFWIYTVFNVLLAILLIVLVSIGIFLIVRAIRPKPHVQLRMVGATSPYARVTIEPNRAEVL
ncbi:leucine-rich repeat neuronal protein 2-like [Anopheles marshallii]|uniref:leucine-rich repeat neuronal protein 2-like n=1 Tax=Anopheles marshallii TaxID=1521116 RepID=UPI00237AFF95|nr:leucine-rich repeat neuronal protein 2-like [Anopheles marshallii]